jgi:hypothetical protein
MMNHPFKAGDYVLHRWRDSDWFIEHKDYCVVMGEDNDFDDDRAIKLLVLSYDSRHLYWERIKLASDKLTKLPLPIYLDETRHNRVLAALRIILEKWSALTVPSQPKSWDAGPVLEETKFLVKCGKQILDDFTNNADAYYIRRWERFVKHAIAFNEGAFQDSVLGARPDDIFLRRRRLFDKVSSIVETTEQGVELGRRLAIWQEYTYLLRDQKINTDFILDEALKNGVLSTP